MSLPARIDESRAQTQHALTPVDVTRQLAQQGFIQFHPALAARLGNFKAALFLGHALYWTRHLALKQPRRGGWFYMTAAQCQQATGLTTREQASVRQLLRALGLMEETLTGKPAKLHFRVNLPALAQWAGFHADEHGVATTWDAFAPWLGSSICFYRPLASCAGSVAAGLYLSLLLQRQRHALMNEGGLFCLSQREVAETLCLGPKSQRNARERLKQAGLLIEHKGSLVRLDLQILMQILVPDRHERETAIEQASEACLRLVRGGNGKEAAPAESAAVTRWLCQPGASKPLGSTDGRTQMSLFRRWLDTASHAQETVQQVRRMFGASPAMQQPFRLVESRPEVQDAAPLRLVRPLALLSKLESAFLSNQGIRNGQNAKLACPFVETNLPFCRNHIKEKNNKTTTTTRDGVSSFDKRASRRRHQQPPSPGYSLPTATGPEQGTGLSSMTMPRNLDASWHEAVRRIAARAPAAVRQALLDELEGQLGMEGKLIRNPAGYLHALIRKHLQGKLALALADKVAADRINREKVAKTVEAAMSGKPTAAASADPTAGQRQSSPPSSEIRARLKQLRQQLVNKTGGK